ncbi:MAG TPA: signal recognition particle-docking protein FtsY, partial [Anaerolineae bacterium]|nr:signal recognition particle-docking protein FtsY [Anaerolineae bacterium]
MFRRPEKIKNGLTRTRHSFFGRIAGLLGPNEVTEAFWEELEELLIQADVGVTTTVELVEGLREEAARRGIRRADGVEGLLRERLVEILVASQRPYAADERLLTVILVVGV